MHKGLFFQMGASRVRRRPPLGIYSMELYMEAVVFAVFWGALAMRGAWESAG